VTNILHHVLGVFGTSALYEENRRFVVRADQALEGSQGHEESCAFSMLNNRDNVPVVI